MDILFLFNNIPKGWKKVWKFTHNKNYMMKTHVRKKATKMSLEKIYNVFCYWVFGKLKKKYLVHICYKVFFCQFEKIYNYANFSAECIWHCIILELHLQWPIIGCSVYICICRSKVESLNEKKSFFYIFLLLGYSYPFSRVLEW